MWNEVIKIINCKSTPDDIIKKGKMLLSQYNTAGGSGYLKKDLEYFVEDYEWYLLID